jgi:rod shape-determining protein MreD
MTGLIFSNTARWVLLLAIQILILNNIYLGGMFNPYIYVLVVLSLPIEISSLAVLLIGFFTGFVLDVFSHTLGLHTMALTLTGYMRPFVLSIVAPRDGYEFGSSANARDMGWGKYALYALLLIFPHHLVLFSLEGFSTGLFWLAVQKTFVNSALTFLMIMMVQNFVSLKDKK